MRFCFKVDYEDDPHPACSTHFTYGPIDPCEVTSFWQLSCTVKVKDSAASTYFCAVGWSPGGYSGIQQIDAEGRERVAIFSMWNKGGDSVELASQGDGVEVTDFGGEGTGLKSMKPLPWLEDEEVRPNSLLSHCLLVL